MGARKNLQSSDYNLKQIDTMTLGIRLLILLVEQLS